MTKTELVEMVSRQAEMTKAAAGRVVDSVYGAIGDCLSRGDKCTVTGFGTFEVRQRAARMGRNPQTGEAMHIPATKTPAFRAGKALKDAVR